MDTLQGKVVPIKLWAPVYEVELQALDQLKNIAALPWAYHHVAVMPDVHYGKGATVGSVIAMKNAISPAAVGVDIGCGMAAVKTSLTAAQLPDTLSALRAEIEATIPVGFSDHPDPVHSGADLFETFECLAREVQDLEGRARRQLGTLGGGNHFIEVCLDTHDTVWIMLHSGSRNIGKTLAEIHIETAKTLAHNHDLPDRDLAVFLAGTPEMAAYRHDLLWAQRYAYLNRSVMLARLMAVVSAAFHGLMVNFDPPIQCHHNYVSEEVHFGEEVFVTRKGAISAREGEFGIIPGSMGTSSFIVRGLGNPESFCSASHGAGRKMSRGQAKRSFTIDDLAAQTHGVECRKDAAVLDEIPGAYKPIESVIQQQEDLVKIVTQLRQVLCVKG